MKLLREQDSRIFLDGKEICREYIISGKITFGSSTLHPGNTGNIDTGHPKSHEVFFVSEGSVMMRNPASGETFALNKGDAILIEEGEPHELTNIGDTMALITWSAAPSPSLV
jgi:mannose-6-phosphate isomerase-like protein (cupin superfamily)